MKINLRKASVVQQTILDEIKRIGTEKTSVSVSLFEANIEGKLDEQLTKVVDTNRRVGRLLEANRFLRANVARKNAEVGIADYLAEEAYLASAEARLKSLSEVDARQQLTSLQQEIDARKSSKESERMSIYGRSEYSVEVNVVPAEVIAKAKTELEGIRKRRRKIKDEMVALNVRTEIEVPEQVALVLTELGLD
jgi:predicted alpha-1,6-mannanase (GH76 family)